MGWSEVAARSHARRLETEGWLARYPMTRGDGSLFVATRTGIRVLGLSLRPAGAPAPTWWAHHCGCAWMAAYLTARGRSFLADRELLDDRRWSGQITWTDYKGLHSARHRPDLVGFTSEGQAIPIEVELTQKSAARLSAIVTLHAEWRSAQRSIGTAYVCPDQEGVRRVTRVAAHILGAASPDLAARPLDSVVHQAKIAAEKRRSGSSSNEPAAVAG